MIERGSSTLRDVVVMGSNLAAQSTGDRYKPEYNLFEDRMEVYDPVWGHEVIDDPVLVELAKTDALRRLQTVEQLTLPDRYKTIPDSTHFSRWEHVWGTVIFAKRLAQEMGLGPEETTRLQLKTLLSDVSHTAHSHAGDWIFEGRGGTETLHDERRQNYAEVVGISDILRRFGHDPKDILKEEKDGIVNSKLPDLDVDRIDYTLREAYRWVDQIPEYRQILNADSFTVKDGSVVVANKLAAKLFGISYTMLVAEHWQEPSHRLQLELFLESIRRVFVARQGQQNELGSYAPVDLMMTSDDVLQRVAGQPDDYIHQLDELMLGVSNSETEHRWKVRADRIRTTLATGVEGNGHSIGWIATRYDNLPSRYEIEPAGESKLRQGNRVHVINLAKLRKRFVDPPYVDEDGEVQRLSETDPAFADYLETALNVVHKDWKAGIVSNKLATAALRNCLRVNDELWPAVMDRPHMPNDVLRRQLRNTVETSNLAADNFIKFRVHY